MQDFFVLQDFFVIRPPFGVTSYKKNKKTALENKLSDAVFVFFL